MQTLTPNDVKTALRRVKKPSINDPILTAVKIEMARQGMTAARLAEKCGVVRGTIQNVLAGTNRKPGIRRKIERALGAGPFCTSQEELERQQKS